MDYALSTLLITLALFFGMLVLFETGRWICNRRLASDAEGAQAGTGVIEGAVFALLGLLIAFTFSGAASRFDVRRNLVIEEANAIGTAYLRLDLLPADAQPALRDLFRHYVDSRLEAYRRLPDIEAAKAELARSTQLQEKIWTQAIAAGRIEGAQPPATMLLLPALNQMIDIVTTRAMATQLHPPLVIFVLLFGLALTSALLAGYGMAGGRSRNWLHMIGFAAVMAVAVYVIIDIEYPRLGLIRVDAFDQALMEVRASMK
ncbi:MAG TPA: DUF4239 domain-containing protein [Candidatus Competibacteraceae bacterium]|nr:DUF4239 domain-containing protein [Candidatus Competibacteraceae bacterium]MCP5132225.1 DUF4239 domain-containing protein [Gammaproteobacteria bacterium]HPF59416.1 DUF4239 domain-containing protein [Candidatus Competibacteraceae bacterium]